MDFSKRISQLRESVNLTQSELADKLGVSSKSVSSWERGIKQPRYPKIERMAEIFGVSVQEVMGLAEEPSIEEQNPDYRMEVVTRFIEGLGYSMVPTASKLEQALTGFDEEHEEVQPEWVLYQASTNATATISDVDAHARAELLDALAQVVFDPRASADVISLLRSVPGMARDTAKLLAAAAKGLAK